MVSEQRDVVFDYPHVIYSEQSLCDQSWCLCTYYVCVPKRFCNLMNYVSDIPQIIVKDFFFSSIAGENFSDSV